MPPTYMKDDRNLIPDSKSSRWMPVRRVMKGFQTRLRSEIFSLIASNDH